MKRKTLAATILLSAVLCAQSALADEAKINTDPVNTKVTDETLYVGLASEPSMLWGAASGKLENEDVMITALLTDTLVSYNNQTGEVFPNLASSWEWTDETHCRFHLRDDVTMTDGTPLTAEDVVYTVGIWTTKSAATDTGMFIVGAAAEDEHTVTIEFTTPAPDLLMMMGWYQFGIVSEEEVEAAGGLENVQKNPVIGSGRYRFKEWQNGVSITLERNDSYWNPDYKGYFKEIVFHFTTDSASRVMSVEAGELDIACNVPVIDSSVYVSKDTLKTYIFPIGQVSHLWYNMGENAGATKDLKVRQAIDKALNFDAIAQVATAGYTEPSFSYADKASVYYTQTFTEEERAVDVEGAKALLKEAGYENGLELTLLCTQDTVPVATVMQANLAEIGIKLTIDAPDIAQFVDAAFAGNYDLVPVGDTLLARAPNIIPFLRKANIEGPGVVIGGPKWTTDEIDGLIAALVSETDTDKATEELQQLESILKDQMICSNLYPEVQSAITSTQLKGLTLTDRSYLDLGTLYK